MCDNGGVWGKQDGRMVCHVIGYKAKYWCSRTVWVGVGVVVVVHGDWICRVRAHDVSSHHFIECGNNIWKWCFVMCTLDVLDVHTKGFSA